MLFLFKVNGRKYWKISKPLLCEESILVPKSTKIGQIDNISILFDWLQNSFCQYLLSIRATMFLKLPSYFEIRCNV